MGFSIFKNHFYSLYTSSLRLQADIDTVCDLQASENESVVESAKQVCSPDHFLLSMQEQACSIKDNYCLPPHPSMNALTLDPVFALNPGVNITRLAASSFI
jgi:hypothetical protein